VRLGVSAEDTAGTGITKSTIHIDCTKTVRRGWNTGKLTDCHLVGVCREPLSGFYTGSNFAVTSTGSFAQTRTVYSISVPYDAIWDRAYRNDAGTPCTYVDTYIDGADFSPGTSWLGTIYMKDMALPIYNSIGYTIGTTRGVPTSGPHIVGTIVYDDNAPLGSANCFLCITSGTPGTWEEINIVGATRAATVAAPAGGATVDTEARAAIASILTNIKTANLMA
jgi:hypothetical protein